LEKLSVKSVVEYVKEGERGLPKNMYDCYGIARRLLKNPQYSLDILCQLCSFSTGPKLDINPYLWYNRVILIRRKIPQFKDRKC